MLYMYVNLIFFTVLNPYLKLLQIPLGEVDPSAAILTLPSSIYLIATNQVSSKVKFIYPFLLVCFIYAIIYSPLFNSEFTIDYIVSIGILFAPISILIFFDSYINLISVKVLNISLLLWFLTATAQQFIPNIIPEALLSTLISRFSSTSLDVGRGVQSLATEPSAVTYPVLSFLLLSIILFKQKRIGSINLYFNICAVLYLIILSRSFVIFSNLFILLILVIIFNFRFNFKIKFIIKFIIYSLVALLLLAATTTLLINFFPQNRIFDFAEVVLSNNVLALQDFIEMTSLLAQNLGDLRIIQFLTSYNCLKLFPLGAGIGNFQDTFLSSWNDLFYKHNYLRLVPRSNSYGGHVASELGLPGFITLASFHFIFWLKSIRAYKYRIPLERAIAFMLSMFWLYVNSIASLGLPWLMLLFI